MIYCTVLHCTVLYCTALACCWLVGSAGLSSVASTDTSSRLSRSCTAASCRGAVTHTRVRICQALYHCAEQSRVLAAAVLAPRPCSAPPPSPHSSVPGSQLSPYCVMLMSHTYR